MTFATARNSFISRLKQNYGLLLSALLFAALVAYVLVVGENIYLPINDSLDSNVTIYKMAADNKLYWQETGVLPFLGGKQEGFSFRAWLNLEATIYMLLPAFTAYMTVLFLKLAMSILGFYCLGRLIRRYGDMPVDLNVWAICGFIYGILGQWPHAALGFASIPWWVCALYFIYKENKWYYTPIPLVFLWTTSLAMLAIFILFYLVVITLGLCIKNRRIEWCLGLSTLELMAAYALVDMNLLQQASDHSSETIKSLVATLYYDTIETCIRKLPDAFLLGQYHAGGSPLRYLVIPVVCLAFLFFVIKFLADRKDGNFVLVYVVACVMIGINTCAFAFDQSFIFRHIITFAGGFTFSRFNWLNPFLFLLCFALTLNYFFVRKKKLQLLLPLLLAVNILAVVRDNPPGSYHTMYNILVQNYGRDVEEESFYFTWKEYYSEDLFTKIKEEIGYDGEYSAAYGFEPSTLQYNQIATIDGYYSNIGLDYYKKFTKLLAPLLEFDTYHQDYWSAASGRCYLYSPAWDFYLPKESHSFEQPLYINPVVFRQMGGRYVFSRVLIQNSDELGFVCRGRFTDPESPYVIYVYDNQKPVK
ncbi:MAG: hypothetical protein E7446_01650 [Ruminococcaceae bacterium]|nr:hypothetical protein [Oscillospiraceae bacterium]